jgi:hypothetical protein
MNFLTKEQEVVVTTRINNGYDYVVLNNGWIKVWKGKHTMIINHLGYDVYVPVGYV